MQALGLAQRAKVIISGDDAALPKPAPDTLLMACEQAGVKAIECIYVGDAERDIEAGKAAGMLTIIAMYGYIAESDSPHTWGADASVQSPQALIKIIQDLIKDNRL